ncbi:MAG: hypothetical protein DI547_09465 [Sphingobium sp.]|nr:MAG: hypothetical protein DI547_09465 [Sphingobium sp.]
MDDLPNDRKALARQANHWLTRRDAGLMTAEDDAAMRAWLEDSPAHAEAYGRAESIFYAIATLPPAGRFPSLRHRRGTGRAWTGGRQLRRICAGSIAAGLAALAIVGLDLPVQIQADAIAPTGESRRVPLPDGSTALLDSASAIAIDYDSERRIRLLRGQAAFTVAADRAHPFVVEARGGTTTALGTRFIVSRIAPATQVTVTEHSVRVQSGSGSRIVRAGASARYDGRGVSGPLPVHLSEADAWTRGRIRFVNRPLRDVVAELGRYHRGYIAMVGQGIGDLRVNGVFSTSDPVGALDIIERSLGLGSYRIGNRLILLHS